MNPTPPILPTHIQTSKMQTTHTPTTSTQTTNITKEILAKMFPTTRKSSTSKTKKAPLPETNIPPYTPSVPISSQTTIPFPPRKICRPTHPPTVRNNCPRLYGRLKRKFRKRSRCVLGLRESVLVFRSVCFYFMKFVRGDGILTFSW